MHVPILSMYYYRYVHTCLVFPWYDSTSQRDNYRCTGWLGMREVENRCVGVVGVVAP